MKKLIVGLGLCLLLVLPGPGLASESAGSINHQEIIKKVSESKGKLVLINFFASWCPPCKVEIPDLIKLRGEIGADKLVMLGVSLDQDPDAYNNFVRKTGFNYPVHLGTRDAAVAFQVRGIPKTIIYNKNGEQVFNEDGFIEPADLRKVLKKELGN